MDASAAEDRAGVGVAIAVVLEYAKGQSNYEVVATLAVSRETVRKPRARFVRDRVTRLTDKP